MVTSLMGHRAPAITCRGRRGSEVRTRSGCWKCRERRVKCPEQRPTCRHCERLGFRCNYDCRLTWQEVVLHEQGPDVKGSGRLRPAASTHGWMFLNTAYEDFNSPPHGHLRGPPSSEYAILDCSLVVAPDGLERLDDQRSAVYLATNSLHTLSLKGPSWFASREEGFLWEYFDKGITPQCVLHQNTNPYKDVVLRIAASSPGGPLYRCILAVSANQLHRLGRRGFSDAMWSHRSKALHLMRCEISLRGAARHGHGFSELLASAVMLCFFEILEDCSRSWLFHADFAQALTEDPGPHSRSSLEPEVEDVHGFVRSYFIYHDILASTASTPRGIRSSGLVTQFTCEAVLQTMSGCPKEWLALLADITEIASDDSVLDLDVKQRRRTEIEGTLHKMAPDHAYRLGDLPTEIVRIREIKRLAALLYLYSRFDKAGPLEPRMVGLTSKIMAMLPDISVHTNTILWPLFMVATLGIRPDCDEYRRLVLEKLAALQRTRQLGNVKKARLIIIDIWKTRDLRQSEADRPWEILMAHNRHGTISLA